MSQYFELYIDKGTDYTKTISLTDESSNTAINVSGYTVRGQLRRSYYSQNISANLICTIYDGANGKINLTLQPANTQNLKPGRYVFDVLTVDTNNQTEKPITGLINLSPGVTE